MSILSYPESISPYIYRNGFDKICEHKLNRNGVGSFAFYEVLQTDKEKRRNEKAFHKALSKSRGNVYYANTFLERAHAVGFAMVLNGGIIKHHTYSCKKLKDAGKTKDELFKDMVAKGMPIDPQKFCDPAEKYRPSAWLIERFGSTPE